MSLYGTACIDSRKLQFILNSISLRPKIRTTQTRSFQLVGSGKTLFKHASLVTLADFHEGQHTILYIQIRMKLKQKFQLYKYYGIYKYACAIELLYHLHKLRISLIEFRFTQVSFR